jgi:hypothetical protein
MYTDNKKIIEWKWTKGENYDRSKRIYKNENNEINEQFNKEIESSAFETALNHDENTWEILNNSLFDKNFVQFNKREDTDQKLSERQMVCQVNMNPYLTNNSYVNDLSVHDQFLKPVSTNYGKENQDKTNPEIF